MRRLLDGVERAVGYVAGALFGVALCLATYGVATRYVAPAFALDWIPEVVVFLVIWAVLLAVARIERRAAHIRVDFTADKLGARGRYVADFLALALGIGVAGLLFASGVLVVKQSMMWDETTSSSLRVPLWLYYASLSTGTGMQLVFLCERLVDTLSGRQPVPRSRLEE